MENLTKENFFNEMKEKYPGSMDRFCKWIDDYKKRIQWDLIFKEGWCRNDDGRAEKRIFKYHELPLGMQVGIFVEYMHEVEGVVQDSFFNFSVREISEAFERLEKKYGAGIGK